MRVANLPPPMALQEMTLVGTAIDVAMTVKVHPEPAILIAVLHSVGLSLFEWLVKTMTKKPPELVHDCSLRDEINTSLWSINLQISFASEAILVVLRNEYDMTIELLISTHDQHITKWCPNISKMVEGIVSPGPIRSATRMLLLPDQNMETKAAELDQEIAACNHELNHNQQLSLLTVGLFSSPSVSVEAIKYDKTPPRDGYGAALEPIVFTLAENGSLFADRRCLARQCTSYLVTPAHLIFTTSQHLLKFVHLADEVSGMRAVTPAIDDC